MAMASELEQRDAERAREAREEYERRELEVQRNGGLRWSAQLRPVPSERTDDKLILPPSALGHLERHGALDGGILTFVVCLPSGIRTHAGVAEFTAEEGQVGVPPRVALCLTKGAGIDLLARIRQVEIRFMRLPRFERVEAQLQPRGQGFHLAGMQVVNMDLKHVLEETLRGHTALTEGDWLPIRHNGVTYELVVRELLPETEVSLIDTELSVDVMPSEQTEADIHEAAERERLETEKQRAEEKREKARLEVARRKAAALGVEPANGPDVVQMLVRLPEGARMQRRFLTSEVLQRVLDWVESEPLAMAEEGHYRLLQKWPGHCRELGPTEASDTLGSMKFARQEALFLHRIAGDSDESDAEAKGAEAGKDQADTRPVLPYRVTNKGNTADSDAIAHSALGTAWAVAEERARDILDARLEGVSTPTAAASDEPTLDEVQGQELVDVFERLVALGMPSQEAAKAAQRFAPQLRELGEMGFGDWPEAVRLLEKYNGRLLRVANLLSEQPGSAGVQVESAPTTHPAPTPVPVPRATPKHSEEFKAAVTERFQQLVAGGVPANEASTRAIELVRSEVATVPAASVLEPALPAPVSVNVDPGNGLDSEHLGDLAAMGFTDEELNRTLLRKYAGRMERVIDALVNG